MKESALRKSVRFLAVLFLVAPLAPALAGSANRAVHSLTLPLAMLSQVDFRA